MGDPASLKAVIRPSDARKSSNTMRLLQTTGWSSTISTRMGCRFVSIGLLFQNTQRRAELIAWDGHDYHDRKVAACRRRGRVHFRMGADTLLPQPLTHDHGLCAASPSGKCRGLRKGPGADNVLAPGQAPCTG